MHAAPVTLLSVVSRPDGVTSTRFESDDIGSVRHEKNASRQRRQDTTRRNEIENAVPMTKDARCQSLSGEN